LKHKARPKGRAWQALYVSHTEVGAGSASDYCREPVVLLFGFGEQLRFCGFASFSHAAMLVYLQLRPPLEDMLMQNGELPTVCDCMVVPDEGEPIVPCACAKDTPATSAAMAVKVVNVFIV